MAITYYNLMLHWIFHSGKWRLKIVSKKNKKQEQAEGTAFENKVGFIPFCTGLSPQRRASPSPPPKVASKVVPWQSSVSEKKLRSRWWLSNLMLYVWFWPIFVDFPFWHLWNRKWIPSFFWSISLRQFLERMKHFVGFQKKCYQPSDVWSFPYLLVLCWSSRTEVAKSQPSQLRSRPSMGTTSPQPMRPEARNLKSSDGQKIEILMAYTPFWRSVKLMDLPKNGGLTSGFVRFCATFHKNGKVVSAWLTGADQVT